MNINPQSNAIDEGFSSRKAFKETAAERTALRQDELFRISFDISLGINMVLAAVPRIERFKEEIAQLPVNHALIAQLDVYANAAAYTHARCARGDEPEELKAVYEEAVAWRSTLYSDGTNLVKHGKLGEESISGVRNETGYRNVAYDLLTLVDLFRDSEARIAGRTATQPDELNRAERVANQLLKLTARRDDVQPTQPALGDDRMRAVSLMIKSFQEARRAIQFVRFYHGDAELITPSIYTARNARKRDDALEPSDDDSVIQPPAGGLPPAGTQPQTQQPAGLFSQEPSVPIGAPGGNPFA